MGRGVDKKEDFKKNKLKNTIIFLNIWHLLIIAVICVAAGVIIYFTFFVNNSCEDVACYEKALLNCEKISFIREDNNSVWAYDIRGSGDSESCNVQVKLLKMTGGDMIYESLQNKNMVCSVYKEGENFPEKDMSRCHGVLREEFQQIIIDRMHNYLLQNLGEINKEFQKV